jgi:ATP adenylyltransferase
MSTEEHDMERIWAPWRLKYILDSRNQECIFCEKPGGSASKDAEHFILEREEKCFTMINTFPYNNGHLMIAPYAHTGNMEDLSDDEICALGLAVRRWMGILRKALNPDGFNVGANLGRVAGAGFAHHLHWHIVPRWDGDTNFMPVIGGTKVLNQSLDGCYEYLKSFIEKNQ